MNFIVAVTLLFTVPVLVRSTAEDFLRLQLNTVRVPGGRFTRSGYESVSQINSGKIFIGTPRQEFNVMLDTGSSDFWISSTRCISKSCAKQKRYDAKKSSTFRRLKGGFNITYGSGNLHVIFSEDRVRIGNLNVRNQQFGEAKSSSSVFADAGLDGIMGLAFKSLAHSNSIPVFYNMLKQKVVKKPEFTFCKSRETDDIQINEVIFGGSDPDRYTGDIFYTPVIEEKYWKFNVDTIYVGDNTTCNDGCEAVADTGTTLIRGIKKDIQELNDLIGATYNTGGEYNVTCDTSVLPNVSFAINGQQITLTPDNYVIHTSNDKCMTAFAVTQSHTASFWILGGSFLDGLCTVFDMGNKRIGFATI